MTFRRNRRKYKKTTPGNRQSILYRRKKVSRTVCGITGQKISGVPNLRPGKINRLSKSRKKVNRRYGGTYSHTAVRSALKNSIWNS